MNILLSSKVMLGFSTKTHGLSFHDNFRRKTGGKC